MAFIFNCSHEMALAANTNEYTPPKLVKMMEEDLKNLSSIINNHDEIPNLYVWGWNKSIKQQLIKNGFDKLKIPSDEKIEQIRQFASREYASKYRTLLSLKEQQNYFTSNEMEYITDLKQIKQIKQTYITKKPWSSSGRGIKIINNNNYPNLPFLIDKFYNKVLDFAMEFLVEDNDIKYLGLSVFKASTDGKYEYNYVKAQEELKSMINNYGIEDNIIDYILKKHLELLKAELINKYKGIVGIDMMIVKENNTYKIHPCIELNFRMNMGVLSILLYKQYGSNAYITIGNKNGFQAILNQDKFYINYNNQ